MFRITGWIGKIFSDYVSMSRVVGFSIATQWLVKIPLNLRSAIRRRDLQPADTAMGPGPFSIAFPGAMQPFKVLGPEVVSGIREMYARDTYLRGGLLRIGPNDIVLDLGANMGNFTNLALAHGAGVRVVAVEPSSNLNAIFKKSVGQNPGFLERTQLVRAFVGGSVDKIERVIATDPFYQNVQRISEDDLIHRANLLQIDFLKCDIEGGEFELLTADSKILKMSKSVAIEVHSFAGSADAFVKMLEGQGFKTLLRDDAPDKSCTVLATR